MKTLIFRIGYLGDAVVSLPVFRAIRRQNPSDEIILLTHASSNKAYLPEILKKLHLIDQVIEYRSPMEIVNWITTVFRIRRQKPDRLIYLPPSRRKIGAVKRDQLFFKCCGIRRVEGCREFESVGLRDSGGRLLRLPRESEFLVRHAQKIGIKISDEDYVRPDEFVARVQCVRVAEFLGSGKAGIRIAFCVGAKTTAQKWPVEYFRSLGHLLMESMKVELILVGSAEDRSNAQSLVESWGGGKNLCGELNLFETAEVFRHCDLYVGNDTGPMHLAALIKIPCVGIFSGRNNPGLWEPAGERHTVLRKSVPCEGCELNICPVKGHPCLALITPKEVFEAVKKYFQ